MTLWLRRLTDRLNSLALAEVSEDEERRLADEYDARRSYHLAPKVRAKMSYEAAEHAPLLRWVPPTLRPTR